MTTVEALKNLAVAIGSAGSVEEINGNTIPEVIQYIADNYSGESGSVGTLTVTSVAGSASGKTAITVSPTLASGHSYVYKTNAGEIAAPNYLETPTGTTVWNGSSEISGEDGHYIGIYELNSDGKVVKFGETVMNVNL